MSASISSFRIKGAKLSRPLSIRIILAVALAVCAAAICAVGSSIWKNRSDAISDAIRSDQNAAIFLAGQFEQVFQSIDSILKDYRDQIESLSAQPDHEIRTAFTSEDLGALRRSMVAMLSRVPHAKHLSVADHRGALLMTTAAAPSQPADIGGRDYFRNLESDDDDRLDISLPVLSRSAHESVIMFARRVNGRDRVFRGVVSLSVSLTYFERTYWAAGLLENQTFALMREDGTVLFRYPIDRNWVGRKLPSKEGPDGSTSRVGGDSRSFGLVDAPPHLVSVAPVAGFPVVVTITVPETSILVNWRARSIYTAIGALALLACLVVLLVILNNQVTKLNMTGERLAERSASLSDANAQLSSRNTLLADLNDRVLETNAQFATTLTHMIQGLCMFDRSGVLRVCNDRFRQIYGLPADWTGVGMDHDAVSRICNALVKQSVDIPNHPETSAVASMDGLSRAAASSNLFEMQDGRVIAVRSERLSQGGWLETHEDITDRRTYEAKIEFLAERDPLTGVPNRTSFLERLRQSQVSQNPKEQPIAVLMIDVDRFKEVNDSLGHAAGDSLLKEVAERLRSSIRVEDSVARLGGDEFAIIQSPHRERDIEGAVSTDVREAAATLANRILELISAPYEIDGQKCRIGVSIGIALIRGHGGDPLLLLKKADIALYRAKAVGRNTFCFFENEMLEEVESRLRLESDLRDAIDEEEFVLHYQPIIEVAAGTVCGFEALVRWKHPDRGLVPPNLFIPLAEQCGLIAPLGEWILRTACAEAARWPASMRVAVNISAVQFRKTNLVDVVRRALAESGVAPERLEVEITETVLLENEDRNLSILHQLKALGVSISLDDFGTGYSSLSYLTMFPFDKLKIDQSFTRDLLRRSDCAAIVCSAAALGRNLGMIVLAEGVESSEQLEALRMAGVSQAQGYLFGPPESASQINHFVTTRPITATETSGFGRRNRRAGRLAGNRV